MPGHRFILSPEQLQTDPVRVQGPDWQHFRAMRLQPGEELLVSDGQGREFCARVKALGPHHAELHLLGESGRTPEPRLQVTLYQGLARAGKLDWTIEKTTELGVGRFVPVACQRSQVKPHEEGGQRLVRWRELARQAARQSGRTQVPMVCAPCTFLESLADFSSSTLGILLYEAAGPEAAWRTRLAGTSQVEKVALWVGPEGGFAPEEVAAAEQRGIIPVGLGPRILRSETAGVVAVTLALSQWGDLLGGAV